MFMIETLPVYQEGMHQSACDILYSMKLLDAFPRRLMTCWYQLLCWYLSSKDLHNIMSWVEWYLLLISCITYLFLLWSWTLKSVANFFTVNWGVHILPRRLSSRASEDVWLQNLSLGSCQTITSFAVNENIAWRTSMDWTLERLMKMFPAIFETFCGAFFSS